MTRGAGAARGLVAVDVSCVQVSAGSSVVGAFAADEELSKHLDFGGKGR